MRGHFGDEVEVSAPSAESAGVAFCPQPGPGIRPARPPESAHPETRFPAAGLRLRRLCTGHCALPWPWHRGQETPKRMFPIIWVVFPLPLHSGHVTSPPAVPLPWQAVQVFCRMMFSRTVVPRMASQKPMFAWYSRSLPGAGCSAPASPRWKNCEKISRNPPVSGAASRPASEKSKSTGCRPLEPGCRPWILFRYRNPPGHTFGVFWDHYTSLASAIP